MNRDEAVRLRSSIVRLARALNASAEVQGLTPTQASVLGIVAARGPLQVVDLSRLEYLNASMTSRVVVALEREGLIVRKPGATDRRTVIVSVTPQGRKVHRQIRERRVAVLQHAAAGLDPSDRAKLLGAVDALEQLALLVTES